MLAAAPAAVAPRGPALLAVATAFLRRRPLVVAPMFAVFLLGLALGDAPRAQVAAVAVFGSVALAFFSFEAWRGRRHAVSEPGLFLSLVLTLAGIAVASAATGGIASPLVLMAFAPTVIGFAAFGRGRRSDALLALGVGLIAAVALLPPGVPLPPPPAGLRRLMMVVCGADALVLLRLGVAALTDAHAAARATAARAGEDLVASAAARARALEAMGAKVAHEVRNPLAAIRGLVEVIAEGRTDERDRKRLAVVVGEVDRIDGILTGYLAQARPLDRLEPRPHDVGALVREVAAVVEARAERASVALVVDADGATIELDPHRCKEALLNLVLNAIEATPAGGRVELRSGRTPGGVAITVEDSGRGMAPERLATAGTPFATGRSGGTGLGLALARQAIEQHGGTLALESAPGRGTVARVTLPARPGETP
jgi:signal transduction histidine kinase